MPTEQLIPDEINITIRIRAVYFLRDYLDFLEQSEKATNRARKEELNREAEKLVGRIGIDALSALKGSEEARRIVKIMNEQ